MASISLEASIRTSKVNTGFASKMQSDRFLNPNNLVCPTWSGFDSAGRSAPVDSYYTKREGCNSANDRVDVENNQRPQYLEYITLNAGGISGSIYNKTVPTSSEIARADISRVNNSVGNYGLQFAASVKSDYAGGYSDYMTSQSLEQRAMSSSNSAQGSQNMRSIMGV